MRTITKYILSSALLLSACKKEVSKKEPPITCEFAPYTTGSEFQYQYASIQDTFEYTLNVTGDTVMNGNTFSILSSGGANQYIRCDDGRYYLFEAGVNLPGYQTEDGFRLFLYDTKEKGDTWSDTIKTIVAGQKELTLLQYTVLEKGVSKIVAGDIFSDVMAIKQAGAVIVDGHVRPTGTIATYYYAKDIGYIKGEGGDYSVFLLHFNIK